MLEVTLLWCHPNIYYRTLKYRVITPITPYIKKNSSSRAVLFCYQFLEEEVVNFMNEMLTEEGNATIHYNEYDEVFECSIHNNACFDFML